MPRAKFTYKRTPTPVPEEDRIEADRLAAEAWAREHGIKKAEPAVADGSIDVRIIKPRRPGRPRGIKP